MSGERQRHEDAIVAVLEAYGPVHLVAVRDPADLASGINFVVAYGGDVREAIMGARFRDRTWELQAWAPQVSGDQDLPGVRRQFHDQVEEAMVELSAHGYTTGREGEGLVHEAGRLVCSLTVTPTAAQ